MNLLQNLIEQLVGYPVDWESTAAWVQASGAIVALAIAIEIPRRAKASERRTFRNTILAYATAIKDGVRAAAILDGTFHEVADKTAVTTLSMEANLQSLIDAMEKLPLAQLDNHEAVNAAIRLAGGARAFLNTPISSSLTVEEATQILVNGRTPRRHAADQVMFRHQQLTEALAT